MATNLRALSRNPNWVSNDTEATTEEIELGTMLRIADAMEKIAADRVTLERRLKESQEHVQQLQRLLTQADRRDAARRGEINRLKAK